MIYEIEVIDYTKMDVSDLTDASKILNGVDFSKLNGGKVAIFIEMFASAMSPNVNGLINKAYETVRDKREYAEERRQVTFVLDEFSSIGAVGEIPGLAKIMAACRTYRVNFIITVQAVEQLKEMYGENYNEIIANCDSIVMMKSWLWTPDDLEMIKSEEVVEKLKNIDDDECMVMVREYKPMIDKKIAIA